jgi:hypothetical protein
MNINEVKVGMHVTGLPSRELKENFLQGGETDIVMSVGDYSVFTKHHGNYGRSITGIRQATEAEITGYYINYPNERMNVQSTNKYAGDYYPVEREYVRQMQDELSKTIHPKEARYYNNKEINEIIEHNLKFLKSNLPVTDPDKIAANIINNLVNNKQSINNEPDKKQGTNKQSEPVYTGRAMRVPKGTSAIRQGQRITGRPASGRTSQAYIKVGHLGYKP